MREVAAQSFTEKPLTKISGKMLPGAAINGRDREIYRDKCGCCDSGSFIRTGWLLLWLLVVFFLWTFQGRYVVNNKWWDNVKHLDQNKTKKAETGN